MFCPNIQYPHSLPSLEVVLAAFWRNSESMERRETGPHEGLRRMKGWQLRFCLENIEVETRFRSESRELSVPLRICSCPGGWPLWTAPAWSPCPSFLMVPASGVADSRDEWAGGDSCECIGFSGPFHIRPLFSRVCAPPLKVTTLTDWSLL